VQPHYQYGAAALSIRCSRTINTVQPHNGAFDHKG